MLIRVMVSSLAGFGGWKVVETAVSPSDVTVQAGGPIDSAADRFGVPRVVAWLVVTVAAVLALRYFFKSK